MIQCDANEVQINYELLEKTLKCGVCKRLLNVAPIVFNRIMGCAICGRCKQAGSPNNAKDIFPQAVYEGLASYLTYSCSYRKDGCEEILTFAEVQTHEKNCRFQTVSCPLSCTELVERPSCGWTGSAQMMNDHIQQHSDLFPDPPLFEWPEIGHNKVFFTKIGQQIVTVAVKYKSENEFLCLASINDTDLESQCYKYELELMSEDKLTSILFRRDRLQCILNMNHDLNTPENTLQVNIQKLTKMLQNSRKIFAKVGIVKKSNNQIQQITGKMMSEPPASSTSTPESDDLYEDVLSELQCPVCNEFMVAPIFICLTGHSLCNVCKAKINSCPTCQCGFTKGTNFTLEKLAAKIKYPCTNRSIGCKFVSTSDLIRSHESVCKLSKSGCFFHCGWEGQIPCLADHLKDKHRVKQIINNKAFKIWSTTAGVSSFVEMGNQLFLVTIHFGSRTLDGKVSWNICHVSETDHVFQYNIQFSLDANQSCPCLQLSDFCDVWKPQHVQIFKSCIPTYLLEVYLNPSNEVSVKINISQMASEGSDGESEEEYSPKKATKPDSDSDEDSGKEKGGAKPGAQRGGGGYTQALQLSPELAAVVGADRMARYQVVEKIWSIVKEKNMFDPTNRQFAICDDALMKVIGTKRFRVFGMMKYLEKYFIR